VTTTRSPGYRAGLVRELCKLANETGWVEAIAHSLQLFCA
jgi:hypothetical protein